MWKRWMLIIICLLLVIARLFYPNLTIDFVSVWLIGIASILFFIPQINEMIPYLKKMKIGLAEFEFRKDLKELGKQVEQTPIKFRLKPITVVNKEVEDDIEEILEIATSSPQAALLLLSAKLERSVKKRLSDNKLLSEYKFLSLPRMIDVGIKNDLFPEYFSSIVLRFWKLRNQVAHGREMDVSIDDWFSLISVGIEILRLVSLKE